MMTYRQKKRPAVGMGSAVALMLCFSIANAFASEIKIAPGQTCVDAGCHEQLGKSKHVHPAMDDGDCYSCHEQQGDAHAFEFSAEDDELCFSCHDAFDQKKNQHPALEEGCTTCHNPHQSNTEFLLEEEIPQLCFGCHDDIEGIVAAATNKHGALENERRCLNCHNPHTSENDHLLTVSKEEICFTCHDQPIQMSAGELKNMKNWVEVNKYRHGPVTDNDCVSCHEPHGSANFRILKENYPRKFYAPFSTETYALCFRCHEANPMFTEETDSSTGFRNGSQNLHFLHVNKPVKGRTCSNCHDVHATSNPKHIKENAWFGVWEMPIQFEKSEMGGSCDPGCHQYRTYERKNPVLEK